MSDRSKSYTAANPYELFNYSEDAEKECYERLEDALRQTPLPPGSLLGNLGLYLTRASVARMLFMHHLYQQILGRHGVVMEFGCQWGQNLALFSSFRNVYEPQNLSRRIIGFDTFFDFAGLSEKDGKEYLEDVNVETLSEFSEYDQYLGHVMQIHERLAPRSHVRKFELVKGDVSETLPRYLEHHPATIVALAYFDMAVYKPTFDALRALKPYLQKGSIIGLDHMLMEELPGDTLAFEEAFGIRNCTFHRLPFVPYQSYVIVE